MTSRPEPCTLVAASDLLSSVQSLVEAAFMAAGTLGKREEANALQQVLDIADTRLTNAIEILEVIRKGGGA
ncbi:hypothetical protein [Ochrobactrum sp. MYb379]|uniref:hypothetical protein n=1 Tax=Ochrobactrum sp. MYb379 TaxID=2745275 RepID=UPI0030AA06FD